MINLNGPNLERAFFPISTTSSYLPGQDFGICAKVLNQLHDVPILGVCLGHQGIGVAFGAKVIHSPKIMHGQLSPVCHNGTQTSLFYGVPNPFWAVRYHSLVVDHQDSLSSDLITTAWCEEDHGGRNGESDHNDQAHNSSSNNSPGTSSTIMGLQHLSRPIYGVQFHPESVCTEHGYLILRNFLKISWTFLKECGRKFPSPKLPPHIVSLSVVSPSVATSQQITTPSNPSLTYNIYLKELDPKFWIDPLIVFEKIIATEVSEVGTWWLDSAKQPNPQSRFSFMGSTPAIANPFSVAYSTLSKRVEISSCSKVAKSIYKKLDASTTFWDWMSDTMTHFNCHVGRICVPEKCDSIPFDFRLGMVGYFGYEMKRESMPGYFIPKEQQLLRQHEKNCSQQQSPDAAFIFATSAMVFDHLKKRIWIAGLVHENDYNDTSESLHDDKFENELGFPEIVGFSARDFSAWINRIEVRLWNLECEKDDGCKMSSQSKTNNSGLHDQLEMLETTPVSDSPSTIIRKLQVNTSFPSASLDSTPFPFKCDDTKYSYINSINEAKTFIRDGKSYEICLTTQFRTPLLLRHISPPRSLSPSKHHRNSNNNTTALNLYKHIRVRNPAPFSALIDFTKADTIVLCSSPEKFMSIGNDGVLEMKPIKGTVAVATECFCDKGKADGDKVSTNGDKSGQSSSRLHKESSRRHTEECERARKNENEKRVGKLMSDVKERAENLMIVDLIRNDLAHTCPPHTITVQKLMQIETYETVHQMVTTVRGRLRRQDVDCVRAIRACFPPGSMTGAPKLRTIQLLDQLENHAKRGVYSGCLGYLSLGNGAYGFPNRVNEFNTAHQGNAVFNVVIRAAIVANEELSIGAGGAITYLSDADAEWSEVLLKSKSVIPGVLAYLDKQSLTVPKL